MRKNYLLICFMSMLVLSLMSAVTSVAIEQDSFSTKPVLNHGKKWRIGYLEGGNYPTYGLILKAIIQGLINLGWIEDFPLPSKYDSNKKLWEWIAVNAKSNYIEFDSSAFWTSDFKEDVRIKTKADVLERLNKKKDIDLMLALGTWAGQDLANNEHSVPTVIASTGNAVESNIIKSVEDSGYDHIHAKIDPLRYERQVRIFHDIIKFSRLGVVYEDSFEGRTFAGINAVEKVAKQAGFEIIYCLAPWSNVPQRVIENKTVSCYTELAPKVDAVYITLHRGVTPKNLSTILAPLLEKKIPTFSMFGSDEVKQGVLMSTANDFKYVGEFHAEIIAKIFNGAKPRDLTQEWSGPTKIAINLETAKRIGYDPPFDVLTAADEIYIKTEDLTFNPD